MIQSMGCADNTAQRPKFARRTYFAKESLNGYFVLFVRTRILLVDYQWTALFCGHQALR